jgi:hypothetical protein
MSLPLHVKMDVVNDARGWPWYGKVALNPTYTNKLVKKWKAPPSAVQDRYYEAFPTLYPTYLPQDHYIVEYDVTKYPTNRDYRTFKSAPPEVKSPHRVEWEYGYGPCNVCTLCVTASTQNEEQRRDYYRRLEAWRTHGTPM